MSFVGTRPEAVKYVEKYKPEYMARVHEDSIMTRPFCEKNYHGYFICTKELILLYRTKYKDEDMYCTSGE